MARARTKVVNFRIDKKQEKWLDTVDKDWGLRSAIIRNGIQDNRILNFATGNRIVDVILKFLREFRWDKDLLDALNIDETYNVSRSVVKDECFKYGFSSLAEYEKLPEHKKTQVPEWILFHLRRIKACENPETVKNVGNMRHGVGFYVEQMIRDELNRMDKEREHSLGTA